MINNYTLIEVNSSSTINKFLDFPATLYKTDKYWIRPLDVDIEKIFNPNKNKSFKSGKAIRWILESNNRTIGRIAAFYDHKTSKSNDQPTGGVGFFDCINDQDAAKILFDSSKSWLEEEGMEAMDGPINFGSREIFWGCLKEGNSEPVYNMPHNHSYYNDLFENYGFKNYFNQYTYHVKMAVGLIDPKIRANAEKLKEDTDISFEFHDKKNPNKSEENFLKIFNAAWAKFPGVRPLTMKHSKALFNSMKPIIDPKLIIFAYHKEIPIGFYIMVPDINPIIKKFNGKLNLINKLRLIFDLKVRKGTTRALGLIFGVVPDFQGRNITDGMINFMEDEIGRGIHYTDLEMNWIGDFNPRMINMVETLNPDITKVHVTYRYLFDRIKPFKRAKIL